MWLWGLRGERSSVRSTEPDVHVDKNMYIYDMWLWGLRGSEVKG